MSPAKVLVFEPSLSGHRAHYVAVQTKELLRLGLHVSLAVPDNALEQPEGLTFLKDVLRESHVVPLQAIAKNLRTTATAKAKFTQLQATIADVKPVHCYVPYADGLAQAWGMHPRPNKAIPNDIGIEGIMMRGRFAYPGLSFKSRFASQISRLLAVRGNWTRLHQLDPLVFEYLQRSGFKRHINSLIPEIIQIPTHTDTAVARKNLNLDPHKHVIACPGGVNGSKGSGKLIDAVISINDSNIQLVLIGKHSTDIKTKLKVIGQHPSIISQDRFASETEFTDLFAAADTIAVCYPRHVGSASILLRAAAAGKNIIASDWGWIGWTTKKFKLGNTCDATSVESIRKAILQQKETAFDTEPSGHGSSLLSFHTPENHLAHWTSFLRTQVGLPAATLINFQDVLDDALQSEIASGREQ